MQTRAACTQPLHHWPAPGSNDAGASSAAAATPTKTPTGKASVTRCPRSSCTHVLDHVAALLIAWHPAASRASRQCCSCHLLGTQPARSCCCRRETGKAPTPGGSSPELRTAALHRAAASAAGARKCLGSCVGAGAAFVRGRGGHTHGDADRRGVKARRAHLAAHRRHRDERWRDLGALRSHQTRCLQNWHCTYPRKGTAPWAATLPVVEAKRHNNQTLCGGQDSLVVPFIRRVISPRVKLACILNSRHWCEAGWVVAVRAQDVVHAAEASKHASNCTTLKVHKPKPDTL